LADNAHLIARFQDADRPAPEVSTERRERVYFFQHEIMGLRRRLKRDSGIMFRFIPHDFFLSVENYYSQERRFHRDALNQSLDIYAWTGLASPADLDRLALKIGRMAPARHVWRAESAYKGAAVADSEGAQVLSCSIEDRVVDAVEGRNRFGSVWTDIL
jgi:hypothetical protein